MKDGRATTSGPAGQKREPISHAISPAGVSQFGETVDKRAIEEVNKGRGYKAPMAGCQTHNAGSQGRHD